jgi:hypothetical protein
MRRRQRVAVVLLVVAVVLVASIVALGSSYKPPPPCAGDTAVASYPHSLTPYLLLNSPYLGTANASFVVWNNSSGQPDYWGSGLVASNGTVWAYYEDLSWRIGARQPGAEFTHCGPAFLAIPTDLGTGGSTDLAANLTSDVGEPNSTGYFGTTTGYSLVYFYNSFTKPTLNLSTCGGPAQVRHLSSHHVEVGVPFSYGGSTITALANVTVTSSYNYTFPANGGIWEIDNLSAPGGPGGGWAFSYAPCA